MEFRFTEEQEKLRQEVRDFLEAELRAGSFTPMLDSWVVGFSPEFSRKIAQRGWIGFTWPKEYGGQGRSYTDRLIITEELLRYGAPVSFHWIADRQMGPSFMRFGTEEQKKEFLPRIIRGEISFCIGMSEPNAGSDLASLQTRAVETEDGFILNGQKIWTGGAHRAHYCYLVARTDPTAPKHKGISEFVVDMSLPGIEVRPVIDMLGHHHLNEVFFDNVKLPKSALIGEKNRGWYQIAAQLDYERSGLERIMSNYLVYQGLLDYARETPRLKEDPLVRHRLSDLVIEFEVGRWLIYRVAWVLDQGRVPNFEAAQSKVFGTAFQQKLAQTAMEVLGLWGQLLEERSPLRGWAAQSYMFCRAYTIMGGTSEILRNVVALRGLGLPSG